MKRISTTQRDAANTPCTALMRYRRLHSAVVEEIKRRSVITASAWSVPVIAAAATAPLAAASTLGTVSITYARRTADTTVHLGMPTNPACTSGLVSSMFSIGGATPTNIVAFTQMHTVWSITLYFFRPLHLDEPVIVNIPGYQAATTTLTL